MSIGPPAQNQQNFVQTSKFFSFKELMKFTDFSYLDKGDDFLS
jgi:hypothetical protein